LHHNFGNGWLMIGLFEDHCLVLMERFDAARAVDLVERHGVTFMSLVPTMMQRILRLPDLAARDFSTVESVLHTAAPCPAWVKDGWIELVGAERVHEVFGATEGFGMCIIHGHEWLEHRGSVGRPVGCEVRILDDDRHEVPAGVVGEIFMRPLGMIPNEGAGAATYIGSPPATATSDGFLSVGDLGWVDDDGWLFVADRRTDLVITGGANVYPAEVEAALSEHPGVRDVAVIGRPDDDLGKAVHAVVEPADPADPPLAEELKAFCRERLDGYKVPRTIEFVDELPRDEAGKIRRSALVAADTAP
jgi:bile acid-coenzyme A ligase